VSELADALEALTVEKEKELVTCLIKDVNTVFYTGLDENPNFSRSAKRPSQKEKQPKKSSAVPATLTISGSKA
jgi:hypothetical protein